LSILLLYDVFNLLFLLMTSQGIKTPRSNQAHNVARKRIPQRSVLKGHDVLQRRPPRFPTCPPEEPLQSDRRRPPTYFPNANAVQRVIHLVPSVNRSVCVYAVRKATVSKPVHDHMPIANIDNIVVAHPGAYFFLLFGVRDSEKMHRVRAYHAFQRNR
jgi:hypothetical protein